MSGEISRHFDMYITTRHHDDVIKWKHMRYWPLWGESTSDAELWCFICLHLNKRLNRQSRSRWFETPSRSLCRQCNGSVSKLGDCPLEERLVTSRLSCPTTMPCTFMSKTGSLWFRWCHVPYLLPLFPSNQWWLLDRSHVILIKWGSLKIMMFRSSILRMRFHSIWALEQVDRTQAEYGYSFVHLSSIFKQNLYIRILRGKRQVFVTS